jgi:hypothetical protein
VDCYCVEVADAISLPHYVFAFYTTRVFKLERFILKWCVAKPSSDVQAKQLAMGVIDTFAAWSVEGRDHDQILLCDFMGSTRSWLMTLPIAGSSRTRLYFGSAVVPAISSKTGKSTLGLRFRLLLGFHKIYSKLLLRAAAKRLKHCAG